MKGGKQKPSVLGEQDAPISPCIDPACVLASLQNQVGSLTMELMVLELRRAEHWQQREGVAVADVGAKLLMGEALAMRETRLAGMLARQEPLLYVGLSLLLNMAQTDVAVEAKMVKKVRQGSGCGLKTRLHAVLVLHFPRRSRLSYAVTAFTPHPANEDTCFRMFLANSVFPTSVIPVQGLLSLLAVILDRGSPQLLLLVTTFLHHLSLFADNCCQLRESDVVGQLVDKVPGDSGLLLSRVLRLLHNLAFDDDMRQQMVAAGLITKAVDLLKEDGVCSKGSNGAGSGSGNRQPGLPLAGQQEGVILDGTAMQQLVLGILYRLSLQDRHRSMFLYTGKKGNRCWPLLLVVLPKQVI